MTARTHDVAALTALLITVLLVPLQTVSLGTALLVVLANQLGGIAPDIDQPTAPLWRNLPVGGIIGRVIDTMLGGHRFLTHSLLGVGIFGGLSYMLLQFLHPIMPSINTQYVWLAFMIGMVSHLIMDTFTKEGVPWLLPIPIKFGFPPLKQLRITTGRFMESWVLLPALVGLDIWLCASHYQFLISIIHRHIT